jgi:hypothetical protein
MKVDGMPRTRAAVFPQWKQHHEWGPKRSGNTIQKLSDLDVVPGVGGPYFNISTSLRE